MAPIVVLGRITEGIEVSDSKIRGIETLGVIAIFALSSATMSWLLWRFPIVTALAAAAILLVLGILAHLSRWSDTDLVPAFRARSLKEAKTSISSLQIHR
jgi:hypothetical protein